MFMGSSRCSAMCLNPRARAYVPTVPPQPALNILPSSAITLRPSKRFRGPSEPGGGGPTRP